MPTPYTVSRRDQVERVMTAWYGSQCVSVVGLSNTGKSTLLRNLNQNELITLYTEQTGRRVAIVYIDCNAMVELSGQGFYELILRSVRESLTDLDAELIKKIDSFYLQVVEPDTPFLASLNFNNAMTAIIEDDHRDLILLFDEFDEAFDALDGRVFLNLRALKDKYPQNLIYVTATVRQLGSKRSDDQTGEFVELSASNTLILPPLFREQSDELAEALARYGGLINGLDQEELEFLWEQTGGHPRLLRASVGHLVELHLNAPDVYEADGLASMQEELLNDVTIRGECMRLWSQLGPDERNAILAVATDMLDTVARQEVRRLVRWGLVWQLEDDMQVFSELLAEFVRRQAMVQRKLPDGIQVDYDSGEVWVKGIPTEPLTELEFKLLTLLHERINKVTDKYQIVDAVWGVEYIDEVDDARIEKLISRLRSKVEPDASDPRFITTVRGRGYKMIGPE